jgi:hypothetical protein
MEKKLGKIDSIQFGVGGYNEAMFGCNFNFTFNGCCGCGDFISGGWVNTITISEYTKWTEEDRSKSRLEMINRIETIMSDAKVDDITNLRGKPVELTFDGMTLKSWRILTEVL